MVICVITVPLSCGGGGELLCQPCHLAVDSSGLWAHFWVLTCLLLKSMSMCIVTVFTSDANILVWAVCLQA